MISPGSRWTTLAGPHRGEVVKVVQVNTRSLMVATVQGGHPGHSVRYVKTDRFLKTSRIV